MKDKYTIINDMVDAMSDVMEAKAEYNELVAVQMEKKGDTECAERLRAMNKRIADAVLLMRENGGCWA